MQKGVKAHMSKERGLKAASCLGSAHELLNSGWGTEQQW
ncbi:hypothetical protein NC652_015746 [Populus alba x Populus x berolinensis]|uniref:Uncharacterized protein n=1 Tax=Populus alba x Populus x berolinensis TaxID=444605 RepID=A0AAD6VYR3_9ROSI|nr:hypothetical protein NC652_015746 [Populus alba x Populus x berolinensis]KAJ6992404.1 hypothetical protein NC653_015708 [Populus alba x Populus x berolinensis]